MVFQCINIRQVPWEVLKPAAFGLGFQHLPRDLVNVNAWKTMFHPFNKTCVASKDSDQPVHPPSMARGPVYPSFDNPEAVEDTCDQRRLWLDCADAQADLSLGWSHKYYCRFCHALAHNLLLCLFLNKRLIANKIQKTLKGSIFLIYEQFICQERFNKLIYVIT